MSEQPAQPDDELGHMSKERQSILRAQRHGWEVSWVTSEVILMRQSFRRLNQRSITIFVWPDGRVTA